MRIFVASLVLILYICSFLLYWLRMPLSHGINLFYFKLPFFKISFFYLLVPLICLIVLGLILKKDFLVILCSTFLLFLGLIVFPLYCITFDLNLISKIFNEQREIQNLLNFISFLPPPPNKQYSPYFQYIPSYFSFFDRFLLWFKYVSWGWGINILASIFSFLISIKVLMNRKFLFNYIFYIFTLLIFFIVLFSPNLMAEFYLYRGNLALENVQYYKANNNYKRALELNPGLSILEGYLFRNALLQCNLIHNKHYCSLLKIKDLSDQRQYISAWRELELIKPYFKYSPSFRAFSNYVSINAGIFCYVRNKGLSQAIFYWLNVLDKDPLQIEALFYLSFANLKIGNFEEALQDARAFIDLTSDETFLSYAYTFVGDACIYLKRYTCARIAYEKAYLLDPFSNYLAMWKMTGT